MKINIAIIFNKKIIINIIFILYRSRSRLTRYDFSRRRIIKSLNFIKTN